MTSTAKTPVFCTNCGTPAYFGSRFCNKCGSPLTEGDHRTSTTEQSGRVEHPVEWPYSFPRLVGETVVYDSASLVKIQWLEFVFTDRRFRSPSPPHLSARVVITNQRVALLDRYNRPLEEEVALREDRIGDPNPQPWRRHPGVDNRLPLSQFWVLRRAANEELYKEFIQNPAGFTKVRTAWWVHGYRKWSWVKGVQRSANGDVLFSLDSVRAFSAAGPGKHVPTCQPEGTVSLIFDRSVDTGQLERIIAGLVEPGAPFREDFISAIPTKPETPAFKAYTNIFWVAVAEVVPIGVLWGAGAPTWVILLVGIGVAWFVLYLLKRFRLWAEKQLPNRQ